MSKITPIDQQVASSEATLQVPTYVGTMGWSYGDWYGPFYPPEVASRDALGHYARVFDAVEIDSTFYGTPQESTVKHWRKVTPAHFLFCAKVPRLITHDAKLTDVAEPFREFVQRMSLLGPKRGPILLQMGPDFTRADLPALEAFLPLLGQLDDPDARFAIEFRHRSLIGPDVSELLKAHGVALAAADYVAMPRRLEVTADFTYVRLIGRHGAFERHTHSQADRSLDLKKWVKALSQKQEQFQEAFVFANDDFEGYAPHTANRFKEQIGQSTIERPPQTQGSLF
jgi:uncharacterized protein YecE (DUF72 family)